VSSAPRPATQSTPAAGAAGKGPRARRADWDALSLRVVFGVLAAIALVFLVAPTIIVLLTSFTASESL
jgi:hypothetical protein